MSKKSNKRRGGVSTRACVTMLALVLVLGCAVGGTIAWLTAQTEPVKNTFTYGEVDIMLKEHKYDAATNTLDQNTLVTENTYKIVPGMDLPKDPFVMVLPDSEDCWVFLKVEEENFIDGLSYSIGNAWKKVNGETNVYYAIFDNPTKYPAEEYPDGAPIKGGISIDILANIFDASGDTGKTIGVSGDISKEELEALGSKQPKLKFTAYAVQGSYSRNPHDAWNVIKDQLAAESED